MTPCLTAGSKWLYRLLIAVATAFPAPGWPADLPSFQELAVTRAKAHQDRFKKYVLQKMEVHSIVQKQRGMCLDFVGANDGLYRSLLGGGPIMVDLADCGNEGRLFDGRVRPLRLLEPREHREGLTVEQIDQAIAEINAMYADRIYDPEITE